MIENKLSTQFDEMATVAISIVKIKIAFVWIHIKLLIDLYIVCLRAINKRSIISFYFFKDLKFYNLLFFQHDHILIVNQLFSGVLVTVPIKCFIYEVYTFFVLRTPDKCNSGKTTRALFIIRLHFHHEGI